MIGTDDPKRPLGKPNGAGGHPRALSTLPVKVDELRLRAQQLSLREQIERKHFLFERLHAANTRLLQSLEAGDVFEAIAEIIANLIGSEEIAIFHYEPDNRNISLEWSCGVETENLQRFVSGAGMLGRAVHNGVTQFHDRQPDDLLLPCEKNLTACVVLKSSQEVSGAIAIFGMLPQKSRLEWVDFELLRFLEVYGAVAIQHQRLQRKQVTT
jgi:uncharacterized protein YigA (DUF484 family)